MRSISKYDLNNVDGVDGDATVQGVASSICIAVEIGMAASNVAGMAGVGITAIGQVENASINSDRAASNTPNEPSVDAMGKHTGLSVDQAAPAPFDSFTNDGGGSWSAIFPEHCHKGKLDHTTWVSSMRSWIFQTGLHPHL